MRDRSVKSGDGTTTPEEKRRSCVVQTPKRHIPKPCSSSAWSKHGILWEPSEPWETQYVSHFLAYTKPLDAERWRVWFANYDRSGSDEKFNVAYADGVPCKEMKRVPATLSPGKPAEAPLSIGNLPEGWMPSQPIHMILPNGQQRLYFWVHGPGVVRLLAAESNDGQHYNVLDPHRPCMYHYLDRASIATSEVLPQGLVPGQWSTDHNRPENETPAPSHLTCNDVTSIYLLDDGSFEMYTVAIVPVGKDEPGYVAHDNAPGWVRVIDRLVSNDGLCWSGRQRIIERDRQDPPDQQFYHLSVTHTSRGRVGMLGHYRCQAQTMDIEWCFSEDGITWHRPSRLAWLPRGKKGQPDSWGIYPSSRLVKHAGKWWLFYCGVNHSHNLKETDGEPATRVMLATTDNIWLD